MSPQPPMQVLLPESGHVEWATPGAEQPVLMQQREEQGRQEREPRRADVQVRHQLSPVHMHRQPLLQRLQGRLQEVTGAARPAA